MADTTTITRFHGAWRLVSPSADGILYYDPSGAMSVQSAPRRARNRQGAQPSPQEALDAIDGYVAYFGTYAVDATAGTVTHQQIATVQPGPAISLVRAYEFRSPHTLVLKPTDRPGEIVWERLRP
jgi:hypothetical protein